MILFLFVSRTFGVFEFLVLFYLDPMKDSKNNTSMDSSSKSSHLSDSHSKKDDKKMTESESERSDDESKLKISPEDKLKLEVRIFYLFFTLSTTIL